MKLLFANQLIIIQITLLFIQYIQAKHYPRCHMIELERCFDKLHHLKDANEDPSYLLTSEDGLNKICRVLKKDFTECILNYVKKCGTPLHKELTKVVSDALLEHLNQICDEQSEFRQNVLEKAPCIHEKVLSQNDYKVECNNPLFITIAWGEMNAHSPDRQRSPFDYALDASCCAYRQWEQCTMPKIGEQCQMDSQDLLKNVIEKLLGGVTNFLCYSDSFALDSETCQSIPPLDEQLSQVNLTYADHQKLSIYAMVKMFLSPVDLVQ